ncbi:MAG: GvpL/GvpF family gas vesicle protein [Candidatus Bathyarchaeia archaeon]
MDKEQGKYFYCVIKCSEERNFGKIGLNDKEVFTIPCGGIAAVVSDSPMTDYELTENNTKKHEKVVQEIMNEYSVVPTEFGTTIKNDIILKRLIKKAYSPALESLKVVENMVELGVKIVRTDKTAFVDAEQKETMVSEILESLKSKSKEAVACGLFSERLVLNASFLVGKELIGSFSEEVERLQTKYSTLKFLYSGPWAPHNFVYIKIGAEGVEVKKKRV